MKKEKRERKNMNLEQAYNILEEFYEEIPGAYDDNWIDYNMETAMRKSCLEEILKRKTLTSDERMELLDIWEEKWYNSNLREAIKVILWDEDS